MYLLKTLEIFIKLIFIVQPILAQFVCIVNLEIFIVKIISQSMAATKINLTKLVHTINANTVRGCSYEKFLHESFFTLKFPDLWYF